MKKLASLAIILMMLSVSISVLINISSTDEYPDSGTAIENFESAVSKNLPFRQIMTDLMGRIQYISGVRHFENIYIGSEGTLLRDIEPPTSRIYSAAKNYIISYAERNQIKPYFMIVPTAAAILQHEIDDFSAEEIYNQRGMINRMYSQFEGKVRTADVYQTLFDHKKEYIYYHTEDIPTALGGYYIYGELCSRLDIEQKSMAAFSSAYGAHDFYGSLADEFFAQYANPDFISLYEYTGENCSFTVEHRNPEENASVMEGLFIYDETAVEDKTHMILGGLSSVTTIQKSSAAEATGSILIFGDKSASSWLPFLAANYGTITFVDLNSATPELLSSVVTKDYDHVLFAYNAADFSFGIDFEKLDFVN